MRNPTNVFYAKQFLFVIAIAVLCINVSCNSNSLEELNNLETATETLMVTDANAYYLTTNIEAKFSNPQFDAVSITANQIKDLVNATKDFVVFVDHQSEVSMQAIQQIVDKGYPIVAVGNSVVKEVQESIDVPIESTTIVETSEEWETDDQGNEINKKILETTTKKVETSVLGLIKVNNIPTIYCSKALNTQAIEDAYQWGVSKVSKKTNIFSNSKQNLGLHWLIVFRGMNHDEQDVFSHNLGDRAGKTTVSRGWYVLRDDDDNYEDSEGYMYYYCETTVTQEPSNGYGNHQMDIQIIRDNDVDSFDVPVVHERINFHPSQRIIGPRKTTYYMQTNVDGGEFTPPISFPYNQLEGVILNFSSDKKKIRWYYWADFDSSGKNTLTHRVGCLIKIKNPKGAGGSHYTIDDAPAVLFGHAGYANFYFSSFKKKKRRRTRRRTYAITKSYRW